MPAAVRTYLTTGLALMGAGFVTAAQINPPLHKAETRVVEAAVSLVAAVGDGLPCSGYNTDGCDISAPQAYTPVVLDTSGSPANIAANIINAVASIPRAFVDALNGLSYALEVTGSWWVYTPTNVLGFDPADPAKVTALVDLAIPFKPVSNAIGDHLAWWAKANLPMDAGCTANAGPHCPDADAMFAKMFKAGIFRLAAGYQFPTVVNPISEAEGAIGNEIPGSEGAETAWSGAYVKLNLLDPAYALINYLQADPSTNTPEPITGAEIVATLDRLGKALAVGFNPFVPMSFLLKGWPYTALTPLFKPFVPIFCKTCNPIDPGLPPVAPAEGAATLVSAAASETPEPEVGDSIPAAAPAGQDDAAEAPAAQVGEPAKDDAPVAAAVAAAHQAAEVPPDVEASSDDPATDRDTADPTGLADAATDADTATDTDTDADTATDADTKADTDAKADAGTGADADAKAAAPSKPVRTSRAAHRAARSSATASADRGSRPAKARAGAASSGE